LVDAICTQSVSIPKGVFVWECGYGKEYEFLLIWMDEFVHFFEWI